MFSGDGRSQTGLANRGRTTHETGAGCPSAEQLTKGRRSRAAQAPERLRYAAWQMTTREPQIEWRCVLGLWVVLIGTDELSSSPNADVGSPSLLGRHRLRLLHL